METRKLASSFPSGFRWQTTLLWCAITWDLKLARIILFLFLHIFSLTDLYFIQEWSFLTFTAGALFICLDINRPTLVALELTSLLWRIAILIIVVLKLYVTLNQSRIRLFMTTVLLKSGWMLQLFFTERPNLAIGLFINLGGIEQIWKVIFDSLRSILDVSNLMNVVFNKA